MKNRLLALLTALVLFGAAFTGCNTADMDNSDITQPDTSDITELTQTDNTAAPSADSQKNPEPSAPVEQKLPDFEKDFFSEPASEPAALSIDKNSFIEYETAKRSFKSECYNQIPYLYRFGTRMSAGFDLEDNPLPTEAYYGLTAYVENQTVQVKIYDYTGEKTVILYQIEGMDKGNNKTAALPITDEYTAIDASSFSSGLFRITAKFSSKKSAQLYFYVNRDEVWLCQKITPSETEPWASESRQGKLAELMEKSGITPENSLDIKGIYYPFKAVDENHRCDTDSWAELSYDIVDEDWSEERKLFAFYEWMRKNLAYDYYQYNNFNHTRAEYYDVYDGTYSVWNTHAGNCLDFSHILLIMCRAQGIPAVTMESVSKNHSWNAIYINDRWLEIDMTYGIKNALHTEDPANIVYSDSNKVMGFGVIPNATLSIPEDTVVNGYLKTDSENADF